MNLSLNELVALVVFVTLILVTGVSIFSRFLHLRAEAVGADEDGLQDMRKQFYFRPFREVMPMPFV